MMVLVQLCNSSLILGFLYFILILICWLSVE